MNDSKKQKNLKYHHLGIPTKKSIKGEEYIPDHKVYRYGYEESEYGIEWMRYEDECNLPEIVKTVPHVAFQVDDLQQAIKGRKVIISPNSPYPGIAVAFIEENGAPIEFIQINEELLEKTKGSFLGKDKKGREIVLEWMKTDMLAPEYAAAMKSVWPIAKEGFTQVEMQFLKAYPEVVGHETYFKPFEPFFKDGLQNVDWKLVEEKMQENLKNFFVFDPSIFSDEMKKTFAQVEHIFVLAKDKKTDKALAFTCFLIRPEYAQGDVKCISSAIFPEEQNCGIGKLLQSSIFKIIPQTKRIFLCTRVTNERAQRAFRNWRFTKEVNPIVEEHNYTFNKDHWIFLEYKVDQSDILQKTAEGLSQA